MNQEIITTIKQVEESSDKEVLIAEELAKKLISDYEKRREVELNNLEQSLVDEILKIQIDNRRKLEQIEKEEIEKRKKINQVIGQINQQKAKNFILEAIFKKIWLPK